MYVISCDYLLSPSPRGNILHFYINLHLYLSNCILFCIFSCFYWSRSKFYKFDCILGLYMFICLCKLEIIQYMLKYKCICIFILSYYILTVAQNTWIAYLPILQECYIVYLVVFSSVPALEDAFEHPQGTNTQIVHSIEVYLPNLLFLA